MRFVAIVRRLLFVSLACHGVAQNAGPRLAKLASLAAADDLEAHAAEMVALLGDPDPQVRSSSLALILSQPRAFAGARDALLDAVASAPPGSAGSSTMPAWRSCAPRSRHRT